MFLSMSVSCSRIELRRRLVLVLTNRDTISSYVMDSSLRFKMCSLRRKRAPGFVVACVARSFFAYASFDDRLLQLYELVTNRPASWRKLRASTIEAGVKQASMWEISDDRRDKEFRKKINSYYADGPDAQAPGMREDRLESEYLTSNVIKRL